MTPLTIRPYRESDRESVRRICCNTADKGDPVERFFRDREVFADLVIRYYTDEEPGSTWVAESGGQVAGYLTGCLDTRRYWRAVRLRIIPAALARALARGTFLHRETGRLFLKGVRAFLRGDLRRRVDLARYPAHLHINILRHPRGPPGQPGRQHQCAPILRADGFHEAQRRGARGRRGLMHLWQRAGAGAIE